MKIMKGLQQIKSEIDLFAINSNKTELEVGRCLTQILLQ